MLKKLLLSSIFGLSFLPIVGMQAPKPEITYEDPKLNDSNYMYEINALKNNGEIGWIMYHFLPRKKAEIDLFEVNQNYRNNKQHRVGFNLFQRFIDDALKHNCIQVTWTATAQDNLDIKTLCTIYEKLVQRLSNAKNYTFSKSDPYGPQFKKVDMTLSLK